MNAVEKKQLSLPVKVIIGLGLGIVAGIILQASPEAVSTDSLKVIDPIAKLFMNLIKMCIVPLVFASLVVGVCGLDDAKKIGKIGGKSIAFFLVTTAFAVTVGLAIATLFQVGSGFSLPGDLEKPEVAEAPGFAETIVNIIPTNPIAALAEGNMLQIIAFAIFVGGAIITIGVKADPVKNVIESFSEIMFSIIGGIMKFAPIAVFALIASTVTKNGPEVLGPLLMLIIAVYLACFLHAAIVYSTLVKTVGKTSPLTFFKAMLPALLFAYSSASSASTIPLTLQASEQLGVPKNVRSFVIPLGATINMDGTAVFQGVCVLFIANVYGISLTPLELLTVILTATLASIGTAGVPGAGTVMLGMVLLSVGLPFEGTLLIMGVERLLDMARTSVNVCGDCACSVVVASSEKTLFSEPISKATAK